MIIAVRLDTSIRGRGYRLIPLPKPAPEIPIRGWLSKQFTWVFAAFVLLLLAVGLYFKTPKTSATSGIAESGALLNPLEVKDYVKRANAYLDRHQQADNALAIQLLERALELEPDHFQANISLSLGLTQSVTKFDAPFQRLIQSQALAQSLIEQYPERYEAWIAYAASLDGQGAVASAIEAYEQALVLNSDHTGAKASVAYLYMLHGELIKALKFNLEALEAPGNLHYINLQIARTLSLLGFDSAAEPWLQRTDELQPDNVFASEARAHFLMINGRLDDAVTVINDALERGVQRSGLWNQLGLISLIRNQHEDAKSYFSQSIEADQYNDSARIWLLLLPGQQHLMNQTEFETQVNQIRATIEAGIYWPAIYLNLANLQIAHGQYERAIDTLELLYPLGFRDHRQLVLWPSFRPILAHPRFQSIIAQIQRDLAQQRDQILRADWVPRNLLTAPLE